MIWKKRASWSLIRKVEKLMVNHLKKFRRRNKLSRCREAALAVAMRRILNL